MRGAEIPDEIDERIDAALRSYAEPPETPESRAVLARMLERARAEKTARSGWRAWLIPAAACAVVAGVALLWVMRAPRPTQIAWTPKAPGVAKVATAPATAGAPGSMPGREAAAGRERAAVQQRRAAHAVGARPIEVAEEKLPKLETFPALDPPTPEEERLAVFAERGEPSAKQRMLNAQQHIGDPLEIAELKIQPLDAGDEPVPPKGKDK